jgi:hypothetical protein
VATRRRLRHVQVGSASRCGLRRASSCLSSKTCWDGDSVWLACMDAPAWNLEKVCCIRPSRTSKTADPRHSGDPSNLFDPAPLPAPLLSSRRPPLHPGSHQDEPPLLQLSRLRPRIRNNGVNLRVHVSMAHSRCDARLPSLMHAALSPHHPQSLPCSIAWGSINTDEEFDTKNCGGCNSPLAMRSFDGKS